MSGTPTEAEIRTVLRHSVNTLETMRNFFDGTMAGAGGRWDTLLQALEGEYLPGLSAAVARQRAGCATRITSGAAQELLIPIIQEYAGILAADATLGFGSGYRNAADAFQALYDWFAQQGSPITIQSRNLTYDTTATAGASNVGNGAMSRLTVDENAYRLEACHVEKKAFRCRADKNSGVNAGAESFEFVGTRASFDGILVSGSGEGQRQVIRSHHAGIGNGGGSLLNNSSFSTVNGSGADKFEGWTITLGGAAALGDVTQNTTNFYRTHPNAAVDASLSIAMDNAADSVILKQTLSDMRISRIDPNVPYFLRIMWNRSIGGATAGDLIIRMGSTSKSVTLGSQSGWQELVLDMDENLWPRQFNEDPFDIEIEWDGGTAGTLLIDDVLFAPMDLIDGTYWFLRQNAASPVDWLVDDTLTFTDTGDDPQTEGAIQYWLWRSGLGYLPSTTGTPTILDL